MYFNENLILKQSLGDDEILLYKNIVLFKINYVFGHLKPGCKKLINFVYQKSKKFHSLQDHDTFFLMKEKRQIINNNIFHNMELLSFFIWRISDLDNI